MNIPHMWAIIVDNIYANKHIYTYIANFVVVCDLFTICAFNDVVLTSIFFTNMIASMTAFSKTYKPNNSSRKHAYIIFDPLKPDFYIVKLGFTGVYIIFLISAQKIDCGYSLEPPRRGGSNEYPQSIF